MTTVARRGVDLQDVKRAAAGRWAEILAALGGVDRAILDGRHHPCPKCGGRDRFRMIDETDGALLCNRCFRDENGDGVRALMWLQNWTFPHAINEAGRYLGLNGASANGHQYAGGNGAATNGAAKKGGRVYPTLSAARDAIAAALQATGATLAGEWHYRDAAGDTVAVVLRFDRRAEGDGKPAKTFRPVSLHADGWRICDPPGPWPPYRAGELPADGAVFGFEGERCADAARSIGLPAVTSAHGSKSAHKSDWSALAGRDVVIVPDHDEPGEQYASDVAAILARLNPPATVRLLRLPGLPEGGDIVDWLEAKGDAAEPEAIRAEIEQLAASAEIVQATPIETINANDDERENQPPGEIAYEILTAAELDSGRYEIEFLIEGTLVKGQPAILGGAKKTLKTSLILDLSLSLALGSPFLGRLAVNRPATVLFMSGESGLGTLQESARRIAESKGRRLSDAERFLISTDLPRLSDIRHLDAVARTIAERQVELLAIDPAFLCMPGADAGNLFVQGEMLGAISRVCQQHGATLLIAHHTKKNVINPLAPVELEDLSWSGFAEHARQWLLIGRRERYEPGSGLHKLWLNVGGSVGHSALWAVDVAEGVYDRHTPRYWSVDVSAANEAREATREAENHERDEVKAAKQIVRIQAAKKRIVEAMVKMPAGETEKAIKDFAGVSGSDARIAFAELLRDEHIEPCEIVKTNRKAPYHGYRIRPDDNSTGTSGTKSTGTSESH